ncbi:hypothetical protein PoB_004622400 [Plakobranchus ocellatus]|uniref:Transmembrane protein n=1 Tax=Plakobranchus ocellatus TaxID=259542 RepID=A0AAV4BLA7_9GAST|nr:hypothetical protein PoB_004622400 [Plakobranchus ocellatus]
MREALASFFTRVESGRNPSSDSGQSRQMWWREGEGEKGRCCSATAWGGRDDSRQREESGRSLEFKVETHRKSPPSNGFSSLSRRSVLLSPFLVFSLLFHSTATVLFK